jgi:uncharacterized protein
LIILDANVLLYAWASDNPEHIPVMDWLTRLLESREPIALPWVTIWGFVRISTHARLWPNALSPQQAFSVVHEWLSQPGVIVLQPGPRHPEILERVVVQYSARGPLVTDAVLAALAIEHGASVASTDRDFARFTELKWINPLA